MGAKENLKESLKSFLEAGEREAGERIETWRSVVANGRVEDSSYQTTLALLGPSIFRQHAQGHIASSGKVPERTNLVGVPARVALAKLRFTFHDGSVVHFDLPSDHKAAEFAADIQGLLLPAPTAA